MKNDNVDILARHRGVAAQPGAPETDADPRNPNVITGWRPVIEPENGVDVLVFSPAADTPVMICHWIKTDDPDDEGDWYEQNPSIGSPLDVEVTHWMPLPEYPALTSTIGMKR